MTFQYITFDVKHPVLKNYKEKCNHMYRYEEERASSFNMILTIFTNGHMGWKNYPHLLWSNIADSKYWVHKTGFTQKRRKCASKNEKDLAER